MLERLTEQKEAVWVSLASLKTDLTPLTPEEFEIIEEMLRVLAPFYQATRELSEEKRVSGSKVIPLMRMIHIELQHQSSTVSKPTAKQLAENLSKRLTESICNMESLSVMSLATLLDPRFKTAGFFSPLKATEAVKRLKSECAAEMRSHEPDPAVEEPSTSHGSEHSSGHNLWRHLDMEVEESRMTSNTTANSIIEVQRYLAERMHQEHKTHYNIGKITRIYIHTFINSHFNSYAHHLHLYPVKECFLRQGNWCLRGEIALEHTYCTNFCSSIKMHK
ncbi:zinc finger BED domain-containing protein 4-like [Nothobranchius furzeri]|uniref:zinc finger BED domain-containing protein 4-like n=1 Tax=Nothobranchius furzeri TaxID=105023 RepID=UPI003904CAAC